MKKIQVEFDQEGFDFILKVTENLFGLPIVDETILSQNELKEVIIQCKTALEKYKNKFAEGGITSNIQRDLFETPELIPNEVKIILDSYDEVDDSYEEIERILKKIENLGYTFDYGLDAVPYGLRPIGVKIEDLVGYF